MEGCGGEEGEADARVGTLSVDAPAVACAPEDVFASFSKALLADAEDSSEELELRAAGRGRGWATDDGNRMAATLRR